MIKRIKRMTAVLAAACMIAVAVPPQLMTAFAANARIAFSDPSASVGEKVKVNMKITSSDPLANADVMLSYDANVLEFVDGTNATGGNGAVRVHGDAGTAGTGTLAFTLNFNAVSAGTSKIQVTSQEVYGSDSQLVTVDQQGNSTVTVSALQSASKDATLKSLKISPGSLEPAFSPEVDTYSVTVGTDVDKVIVSAECTDENATNVVSGNEGLQMGENRVVCRVTAQDGETAKEYVIVVTKAEGGASASETEVDPASQVKLKITERVVTVLPPDPNVKIPDGFKESTINIDGNKVQGWVWGSATDHQYCVLYGMNEAGEKGFYRYDMKDTERTIQRYFEDPAISGSVTKEVYEELAVTYDKIYEDYNLLKILLIAVILIAVVLLAALLILIFSKKPGGNSREGRRSRRDLPRSGKSSGKEKEEAYREQEPDFREDPENDEENDGSEESLPEEKDWPEAEEENEPEEIPYGDSCPEEDMILDLDLALEMDQKPGEEPGKKSEKKPEKEKKPADDDFEIFDL